MNKIGKILADNLRRWRKERGWTQEQLAERAGLSTQAVVKVENGDRWPGEGTISALAQAIGIPEAMLFSAAFPMPKQKPTFDEALEVVATAIQKVQAMSPAQRELFDLCAGLDEAKMGLVLEAARSLSEGLSESPGLQDKPSFGRTKR